MTTHFDFEPKPRWILSLRDLPQERGQARYRMTTPTGDITEVTLSKRKRQVVDALLRGELFCASTVRIGDVVFRLKEDNDLHAETKTLSNGRKYYSLPNTVMRIRADADGGVE